MAEIFIGVLMAIIGTLAAVLAALVVPWSTEPGAHRGVARGPALVALACFAIAALMFFGG